jgi:hypothetical protein
LVIVGRQIAPPTDYSERRVLAQWPCLRAELPL